MQLTTWVLATDSSRAKSSLHETPKALTNDPGLKLLKHEAQTRTVGPVQDRINVPTSLKTVTWVDPGGDLNLLTTRHKRSPQALWQLNLYSSLCHTCRNPGRSSSQHHYPRCPAHTTIPTPSCFLGHRRSTSGPILPTSLAPHRLDATGRAERYTNGN